MGKPITESSDLLIALEKLKVHDHICLLYKNKEEQFASAIPFIRMGLERREQCVYIADENSADTVLEALRADGVDVQGAVDSGALAIVTKLDTYLREGGFDPDAMIAFLKKSTEAAKAAGFAALRATGEMTWALGPEPGVERLIEYEAKLNDFIPNNDVLAICQYNSTRFDADTLLGVIRTHPTAIIGDVVGENPFYVPKEEALHPNPGIELARVLESIIERERLKASIERAGERTRNILESISDAFYTVDSDWRFTYVNGRAEEFLQRTAEQLLGKRLWDEFPEAVGSEFYNAYKEAVSQGKRVTVEAFYPPFDRWFEAHAYPYVDGLSVFFNDITERKKAEKTISDQAEAISKLSTPILQVGDGLLAIPIIGQIDSYRARQLTEQMLERIRASRAKVVVLDITGVPIVDSAVANHLVQTVQAARLLGARVIVTGVSADNAQTLVRIGVDLSRLNTTGDLQSGIREANRLLGRGLGWVKKAA